MSACIAEIKLNVGRAGYNIGVNESAGERGEEVKNLSYQQNPL